MYRVLGADGREYGPVTAEVLRQWIAEGRAYAQTSVQPEGSAEWQPLSTVAEFEALLAAAPTGPVVLQPAPMEVQTSGMATASLVLGILGLCGITALVGLILGIVSLVKINRSGGRLSGQGLAIAGICVSGFMLLFSIPFMAGLTLPAVSRARQGARILSQPSARQRAQVMYCSGNLRVLAATVKLYAVGHNNQLPPAATWCDAIQGSVGSPKVFTCVSEPSLRCAYAFNVKLNGRNDNEVDPQTVLLFESSLGWNGCGGFNAVHPHQHSSRGVNVAFADGSVRQVPASQLGTLRWDP